MIQVENSKSDRSKGEIQRGEGGRLLCEVEERKPYLLLRRTKHKGDD